MSTLSRFLEKVEREGACWIWLASLKEDGYGWFWNGKKMVKAHRWAYEHFVGEIPKGLQVDHTCNKPNCVNPAHMELVTHAENQRRKSERMTHCKRGHERNETNTYTRPDGKKQCRVCQGRVRK